MDVSGRILAALLAILLLTAFPLQYIANNIEKSLDSHIDHYTEQLSDTIRTKGSLDVDTYESFIERLDHTGDIYDIEIEDIQPVTGDEVVSIDKKDVLNVSYTELNSNNLSLEFGKNRSASLNTTLFKIERVSVNKEEIQSFATHTHTNECYAGHRHDSSCYDISYSNNDGYYYQGINVNYIFKNTEYNYSSEYGRGIVITCPKCGQQIATVGIIYYTSGYYQGYSRIDMSQHLSTYTQNGNHIEYYQSFSAFSSYYQRPPTTPTYDTSYSLIYSIRSSIDKGESAEIIESKLKQLHFIPNVACWNCNSNCTGIPVQTNTVYKTQMFSCDIAQDETPICNQVVTSITATNPSQTIKKGDNIITTATATYLDGHTGTVNCTSNFNPNLNGLQTVSLTYSGLVGNVKTTSTRTCTMNVTVINNKTLSYITASPATQVIKKNGSPIYSITAYYMDGSNSALSAGQCTISPIDTSTSGSKTMTISYTEGGISKPTTITVYVDDITSISINPTELTVRKYTNVYSLPFTITANYLYSANKVIASGYNIAGYNEAIIGKQTLMVSYTESGKTVTASTVVNVLPLNQVCPVCGSLYDLNPDDSDPGCPVCKDTIIGISVSPEEVEVIQGGILTITVEALSRDGTRRTVTSWTSNFAPDTLGFQLVDVEYGGCKAAIYVNVKEPEITCPICGTSYPVSEGRCPVCRETITSIIVVPEEVTINQYDTIDLTVIANYADGGMEEVTDWSIDCTTSSPGTFTANVAYGGCSYPIKLTILSLDMITCLICGLSYDGDENPNGCPVCSKKLIGIEAYLSSGSDMVQFGSSPSISVVLIYQDAHRELTNADYSVEGYDTTLLGSQTITVRYKEFICQLEIEVVDALNTVVCPNGHVYYLNEDDSDSGCPYCVIAQSHEVVYYFDITYTYEILEELYSTGTYSFDQNNYLNISVTKKEVSLLKKLQKFSIKTVLLGRKKKYQYGGKIT